MRHMYTQSTCNTKPFPFRMMFPFMVLFLFAMSQLYQIRFNYLIFIVVIWFVLKRNHYSNRSRYQRQVSQQSEINSTVGHSVPVTFNETSANSPVQSIKSLYCFNCGSGMASTEIYCPECGTKAV